MVVERQLFTEEELNYYDIKIINFDTVS